MRLKTLAVAAALLASTALAAHAEVRATQGFADIGSPTADTGDINTATVFTLGELFSNLSNSGFLAGLGHQDFGSVTFDTTVPGSLQFGNAVFGSFTSTKFTDTINNPGSLTLYVLGDWNPGASQYCSGSSCPVTTTQLASFTISFTQTPAGSGAISDSATFSIPPSGAIPELSTWAMMGFGFVGLGFAGIRGRRTATSIA